MIKDLNLKFGATTDSAPLKIAVTPITVFVGPNNAGKSKILFEIAEHCTNHLAFQSSVIVQDITMNPMNFDVEFEKYFVAKIPGQERSDEILFGNARNTRRVTVTYLKTIFENPGNRQQFLDYFVSLNMLILGGQSRINLVAIQPAGDLQSHPANTLQTLFKNDKKREEVRKIILEAFSKYFLIDPTNLGNLKIKLSDDPPFKNQERSLSNEALEYYNQAQDIERFSDGVKAFTGIIMTLIAGDPAIMLIDEPEAFLHPSLAFKLGKDIGATSTNGKTLFASTHSSSFLMGCIQSGAPINIIRLTYSNNSPTARLLPSDKVSRLMRHPLLRSTGILNALFYEYVIVTEADSDRAFYQEINERLLTFDSVRGIPNCLFINAQNKQTIHEIIKPLREMGIPCIGIVDIDILKEPGTPWTNLLKSAFMPEVSIQATTTSRGHLKSKFDKKGVNFKIHGGVDVLDSADKEACNNLLDELEAYGIFVVRKGELESWLKPLGAQAAHSPQWLIEIFEKLGDDPNGSNYVKPAKGDVWDFIKKMKGWFTNPNRKGIPS